MMRRCKEWGMRLNTETTEQFDNLWNNYLQSIASKAVNDILKDVGYKIDRRIKVPSGDIDVNLVVGFTPKRKPYIPELELNKIAQELINFCDPANYPTEVFVWAETIVGHIQCTKYGYILNMGIILYARLDVVSNKLVTDTNTGYDPVIR